MDDITVIICIRDKDEAERKLRQVMIRAQPYIRTQLSYTQNIDTPFNKATYTDRSHLKYWRSYATHTAKCKLRPREAKYGEKELGGRKGQTDYLLYNRHLP